MSTEASQLEQLQEQHAALKLRAEIKQLQELIDAPLRLEESADFLSYRRNFETDEPYQSNVFADRRYSAPHDRKDGACFPLYQTEMDLAFQRGIGRFFAAFDENSIGILENLIAFTFGTGFVYTAQAQDESAEQLAKSVQHVIDRFIEDNGWEGDLESEAGLRAHRDGEVLLHVRDVGSGRARVSVHEPEWITEPHQCRELEAWLRCESLNWKFGVASEHGYPDQVRGYFSLRYGDQNDWECLDVRDVCHIKLNVDRGCKRGVSDFLAPYRRLDRIGRLGDRTEQGAAIQAAIAYVKQHAPGVTGTQVSDTLKANATHISFRRTPGGGTTTQYVREHKAGMIPELGAGQQYVPGPMGQANVSFIPVLQAALRSVGIRWNMPEYMVSGDASNANYSSTLVAGGPFDRSTQRRQAMFKRHFAKLFWRVLDIAARYGRFRQWGISTGEELRAAIELTIEAPGVAIRNTLQEEQIREIQKRNGVLSARTWASQADLDYDVEVGQGAKDVTLQPPAIPGGPA
jgi:hypothetical protein